MRSFRDTFETRKRLFISACSICMTVPSRKEINRLSSKGRPNVYLKNTIEKRRSQNFDFLSLKNLSQDQLLESSNSSRYH